MELNRVTKIDGPVRIRRALVSTADKKGLETFIPGLLEALPDIRIYSTGGTYTRIAAIVGAAGSTGIAQISSYTGQPEMQGGLVKTLDYRIYLGLLSETYNEAHAQDLMRAGAQPFDLVVVNLYPFKETVGRSGVAFEEARGNIDIGGPCMLRAAAKNFLRVAAVCSPDDYAGLLAELRDSRGALSLETRFRLAKAAFRHTAEYDAAIAEFLATAEYGAVAKEYEAH